MTTPPPNPLFEMTDAARLRLFVSGRSEYAIYMLTPEGNVNSWNAGAQQLKGYVAGEIIGKHFSRFYTSEDQAADKPSTALNTALTEGKFEEEGWRVRKDGSRFWASVVMDPIRDLAGALVGFATITRDIGDHKAASEDLLASERRFRYLVQGVTDYAIYMLSTEGHVINWNAGAQRIKGYTPDEVLGSHFSRFYSEEDRNTGLPMKALEIAINEGRFEAEGWRLRKDGSRFWANVIIDPIRNDQGELIGFAKVTRDITERRDAALALDKAKEALFQSQKLETIGKLTGGVAHDFNNLLTVMSTGLEMMSNEPLSASGERMLAAMQRAVSRGATLTQQLMTFARQQPLRQDRYNVNTVISKFEGVLRRAINSDIRLEFGLDPATNPVMIDAAQFESALLNLVTNARDAMPEGGRVTITTENVQLRTNQVNQLPEGRFVKVTVKDTGTGMLPQVADRAMEPFFTTKAIGKGTGLGLSQVHGLAHQFGGDIEIESEFGHGASISLFMPALPFSDHETASAETNAGNDKALVVDDQPDVLEVAAELFRNMGYDVLSAKDAFEAIEILKRTPEIDVLFSDIVMPGMNGVDLGYEARKLIPGIKVILASGYSAPPSAEEKSSKHGFHFIKKPYRTADIVKKLRTVD
jgi:PAS domain S-box-containing protein